MAALQSAALAEIAPDEGSLLWWPARAVLGDCHRPRYRVFRMGGDVLFDCEFGTGGDETAGDQPDAGPSVARVI